MKITKEEIEQMNEIVAEGFKNYIDILQSDSFKYSMQNTPFRRVRAFPEAKTVVTQPLLCPCR